MLQKIKQQMKREIKEYEKLVSMLSIKQITQLSKYEKEAYKTNELIRRL